MRHLLPAGHRGLLVECADLDEVLALHAALRADPPAGVEDLVPAARTLLLRFDASTTHARVAAHVRAVNLADMNGNKPSALVQVPVRYDGVDLPEIASLTGMTEAEIVRTHLAGEYVVAFAGFAPGFAYIAGGDPRLQVPRRATPRTRVPAGSVALASEFTGIYPREGPGGWQLLGHTDLVLWDLERTPPALLTAGTRVRFVEAA